MADRFMYVPMIGLSIMAAWGVRDLGGPAPRASWRRGPGRRNASWSSCAVAARAQVAHWEDSVELWQPRDAGDAGELHRAREPRAGAARARAARRVEGELRARARASRRPHSPGLRRGDPQQPRDGADAAGQDRGGAAITSRAAVRINPAFAEAQTNLGNALAAQGQPAEAIEHYREAIRLKPDYTEPRVGLGGALLRLGRAAEAIPHYREALRLDPNLARGAQRPRRRAGNGRARRGGDGGIRARRCGSSRICRPRTSTSRCCS